MVDSRFILGPSGSGADVEATAMGAGVLAGGLVCGGLSEGTRGSAVAWCKLA